MINLPGLSSSRHLRWVQFSARSLEDISEAGDNHSTAKEKEQRQVLFSFWLHLFLRSSFWLCSLHRRFPVQRNTNS